MLETYSSNEDLEYGEFQETAEKYFNNYLSSWCERNRIDASYRAMMIRVLSDYSNYFFDSLASESWPENPAKQELRN